MMTTTTRMGGRWQRWWPLCSRRPNVSTAPHSTASLRRVRQPCRRCCGWSMHRPPHSETRRRRAVTRPVC
jgi:hypothetical protein